MNCCHFWVFPKITDTGLYCLAFAMHSWAHVLYFTHVSVTACTAFHCSTHLHVSDITLWNGIMSPLCSSLGKQNQKDKFCATWNPIRLVWVWKSMPNNWSCHHHITTWNCCFSFHEENLHSSADDWGLLYTEIYSVPPLRICSYKLNIRVFLFVFWYCPIQLPVCSENVSSEVIKFKNLPVHEVGCIWAQMELPYLFIVTE